MSRTSWLLSRLSFEELLIAIWSGSCLDLKGEDYEQGILCAIGIMYRAIYKFKLVYRFKIVYIFKVVHRVTMKLSLHDHMITLVPVLLSLPHLG
jgi:hypothetical protein